MHTYDVSVVSSSIYNDTEEEPRIRICHRHIPFDFKWIFSKFADSLERHTIWEEL